MNIVEWFYVVMCVGIAWIVMTTPYLVEKLVKVIKEIRGKKRKPLSDEAIMKIWEDTFYEGHNYYARAIEKAHGITGVDDE